MMQDISTISEFLLQAGTQYDVYDLSRGIRPLSTQQFLDIESAQVPHPFPRQQHGWFALIFKNKQLSGQHYIWFVKLPLDELGHVVDACRLEFLQIIINALGQQLENTVQNKGQLPDNPYSFTPSQQQMADFNSISRKALGLAPSQFFSSAEQYFSAPEEHDWQALALQGISDFVFFSPPARLNHVITKQLGQFPVQVVVTLLSSLENRTLNKSCSQAIIDWAASHSEDTRQIALALRALSLSSANSLVTQFIMQCLDKQHDTALDILIVIAGRHWQRLQQKEQLQLFFEQLAVANQKDKIFAPLFADLVQIPEIREQVLAILRWPEKSSLLTQAVGELFTQESRPE